MRLCLSLFAGDHVAKQPRWTGARTSFVHRLSSEPPRKRRPHASRFSKGGSRGTTVSALFATCELDLRRRARNVKPRDVVAFETKFIEHGAHGQSKKPPETIAKGCQSSHSGFHPGLHCSD